MLQQFSKPVVYFEGTLKSSLNNDDPTKIFSKYSIIELITVLEGILTDSQKSQKYSNLSSTFYKFAPLRGKCLEN